MIVIYYLKVIFIAIDHGLDQRRRRVYRRGAMPLENGKLVITFQPALDLEGTISM